MDFKRDTQYSLTEEQQNNLWISRDYDKLLRDPKLAKKIPKCQDEEEKLKKLAYIFGEIAIGKHNIGIIKTAYYHPDLGFWADE